MQIYIYGPWVPGPLGNPSNMQWLTLGKPASINGSHKGGGPRSGQSGQPKAASFMEAGFRKVNHRMLLGFPKGPGTQGPGTQGPHIHVLTKY
jgi:hypothetical protein